MIKVVGIDISLNNLGVCKATIDGNNRIKVVELELIQPPKADEQTKKQVRKNSDDLRRARWLRSGLMMAIEGADIVTIEMPVGSQSARAMVSYGISLGVVSGITLPMIEVTPYDVKLAGAGTKTATKHEMIDWAVKAHPEGNWKTKKVKGEVSLTNDNEHLADALATIYAAMKTDQMKASIAFAKRWNAMPKELVA